MARADMRSRAKQKRPQHERRHYRLDTNSRTVPITIVRRRGLGVLTLQPAAASTEFERYAKNRLNIINGFA